MVKRRKVGEDAPRAPRQRLAPPPEPVVAALPIWGLPPLAVVPDEQIIGVVAAIRRLSELMKETDTVSDLLAAESGTLGELIQRDIAAVEQQWVQIYRSFIDCTKSDLRDVLFGFLI